MRVLLFATAAFALSACGSDDSTTTTTVDTPSGTTTVTDGRVSTAGTMMADEADDRIETALDADADLARFDLDADDEAGRVRLLGTVDTDAQRAAAEAIATQTAPGVGIDNQITVR